MTFFHRRGIETTSYVRNGNLMPLDLEHSEKDGRYIPPQGQFNANNSPPEDSSRTKSQPDNSPKDFLW
jgi:hypothetical protein